MTQTISVNGTTSYNIPRDSCEWTDSAYLGEVGTGRFTIDDAAGTATATGHKAITVVQDAGTPTRLYTGTIGRKSIKRESGDAMHTVSTGRFLEVSTNDLNDRLNRYIISGTDGKRSAETVTARVSWLLGSTYLSTLATDEGAVSAWSATMDATDYRGQRPGDVLAACAKKASFNYYVRYHSTSSAGAELVFRDDNTSTSDTSTISIAADSTANGTAIFAPHMDTELSIDPEHVYSDAYAAYAKGVVTETRAATASAYVTRWGSTDDAGIKTETRARSEAVEFLWQSRSEEHALSLTLRMRAAYVNLIRAGQRVSVTLPFLTQEGYGTATYFRVLRRRVTQPLNTDNDYDVALDLSPQESISPAAACGGAATASGTYYPLGGSGSTPNASNGVIYYFRPGLVDPAFFTAPQVGNVGSWHFPAYGAGGSGTTDYAGDCAQNSLYLMTIGNGTWTIQTRAYGSVVRALEVQTVANGAYTFHSYINSGDSVVVTISDTGVADCLRVVRIKDRGLACGSKWGWSQAAWVAA